MSMRSGTGMAIARSVCLKRTAGKSDEDDEAEMRRSAPERAEVGLGTTNRLPGVFIQTSSTVT